MQVSIENISQLGRRLKIEVPSERIEQAIHDRLIKLTKQVKIAGFRPGKVPFKVVEQQYADSVRDEVIHDLMQQTYYEAVVREKINPAGHPHIHHDHDNHPKKGEPLTFTAEIEVFPEIKINDFKGVKVEKSIANVTDADVDKTLHAIAKQYAKWKTVQRAAKLGDQVVLDFDGSIDGKPLEGGTAKDFTLELGSNSMIPGFEEGVLNTIAGQDLVIKATFPANYHVNELASKIAEFKIHVHAVKESEMPVIDAEFAKQLGVSGGVDALRAEVRQNMDRELQQALKNKVKLQVMDALYAGNTFTLPTPLIDQEIHHLQEQMHKRLGGKVDFKVLAEHSRSEFESQAQRRVGLGLLLAEIIKQNNMKPDAEKVRQTIDTMAAVYENPADIVKHYYSDKKRLAEIEALVLEEQVVEKVLASAIISEKSQSFDDIMKQKQ